MAKAGPNDWLLARQVDIDGNDEPGSSIYKLVVENDVTVGDVTITEPLGEQAAAASVSTTASTEDVARIGATNETAPATDTATSGLNGRLQRIAQRITSLIALLPASLGPKATSASLSVASATLELETVAASQTDQVLGGSGATGDLLSYIIISPANTSPGNVIILDNATPVYTFAGGASSVPSLVPIIVPFDTLSTSGAWKCTTGADVSVTALGDFTA